MTHEILVDDRAREDATPPARALISTRGPALSLACVHRPANFAFRFTPHPTGGATKRAFDILAAGAALAALSPLLLVVALAVKCTSPGPVLFQQRRSGFRGKAFSVWKFRTMRDDADGVAQAQRGDARVTAIGSILRRLSVDELPQLFNVLVGDMSLIGPRPHAVAHDDLFWRVDPDYPRRFVARPGLTGLAQINGERGLSDTPEKVRRRLRYDLAYVDAWSFSRDMAIVFATVKLLLTDKNAY